MNMQSHYDSWKLTPPWETHRASPCLTPSTVRKNVVIEDRGLTIDLWGHYCTQSGQLVSVQLSDRAPHISPAAEAWINAQPTPEERNLREFQAALGRVIDLGRANGIDVAFINPLAETAKALAENAITDQREVAA